MAAINVKIASGIKMINFGFYPYTPMCVSTVYSGASRGTLKKVGKMLLRNYKAHGFESKQSKMPVL